MRANVVLSMMGKDRIGLVEEITRLLLEEGGNVETSRMARLGGEFAMLMLISLPAENLDSLVKDVSGLTARGYQVAVAQTDQAPGQDQAGWLPYQIEVHGADHEGIVHEIAQHLSRRGINIESVDTNTTRAPVSGTPLFSMTALVSVPPGLADQEWENELHEAGQHANVDIKVLAMTKA